MAINGSLPAMQTPNAFVGFNSGFNLGVSAQVDPNLNLKPTSLPPQFDKFIVNGALQTTLGTVPLDGNQFYQLNQSNENKNTYIYKWNAPDQENSGIFSFLTPIAGVLDEQVGFNADPATV
jgi:hypothetical protein